MMNEADRKIFLYGGSVGQKRFGHRPVNTKKRTETLFEKAPGHLPQYNAVFCGLYGSDCYYMIIGEDG